MVFLIFMSRSPCIFVLLSEYLDFWRDHFLHSYLCMPNCLLTCAWSHKTHMIGPKRWLHLRIYTICSLRHMFFVFLSLWTVASASTYNLLGLELPSSFFTNEYVTRQIWVGNVSVCCHFHALFLLYLAFFFLTFKDWSNPFVTVSQESFRHQTMVVETGTFFFSFNWAGFLLNTSSGHILAFFFNVACFIFCC